MSANFAFSTQWLDLRECSDAAARDSSLVSLIERAARRPEPLKIIDLGAGTGANLRYLAPRLPTAQEWLLVDSDASLLQAGEQRLETWAAARGCALERRRGEVRLTGSDMDLGVRSRIANLSRERESLELELSGQILITAAALLDLVSAEWLRWLVSRAVRAGAMVLFALNYTGLFHCNPPDPQDEIVRTLFNRHQRIDKGFGPAVGPDTRPLLEQLFTQAGYRTQFAPSDWQVPPEQHQLQQLLIEGWLRAAIEMAAGKREALEAWAHRRLALIEQGRSRLRVQHFDVVGIPP